MVTMTHAEIDERQIPELYLMGKLPPEDAAGFEEHYLHCQECLDRLELAESLERGFKRAAGQDAARVAATRQLAVLAWLSRLGRSRQLAALAMTVLVVAVVPGLLGLREVRERERELSETRTALEQERERSARAAFEAESKAGSEAAAETRRLQAELDRASQARATAEQQLAEALKPQTNVPISFLDSVRGEGEPPGVPLPKTPGWLVFSLTVDSPLQPSYRAVLRDAKGREVWSDEGLKPDGNESLNVSLPSTLFAPGDYSFEVGRRRLPFRVLK